VIVAGYRLAALTCPGATAGQACGGWVSCSAWRATMMAGSTWLPAGTASARRSKYRSKPAGASTSTNRATAASLGWRRYGRSRGEAERSCRLGQ
jgi:hypothetical protein